MEITLHRRNGLERDTSAEIRKCTENDIEEIEKLQQRVHNGMEDPEQFLTNSTEELADDLKNSLFIGVWAEGALAAYGILRYCGDNDHNYARYLGVPQSDWQYWANGDTVLVAEEWRGNHIQQLLMRLLTEWRNPRIVGFGCTVSPLNIHSLENIQADGFEIGTRRIMYGEHDRYVMKKELEPLPGLYRHFKGNDYRVVTVATNSETQERMVVYQAMYGKKGLWVRPLSMWFEHIERDGYSGPRFVYIGEA